MNVKYVFILLSLILVVLIGVLIYVHNVYSAFRTGYVGGREDCFNEVGIFKDQMNIVKSIKAI